MTNIFDPSFQEKFNNLQTDNLSESMQWWTPEDREKFYVRLIGILDNMSLLKSEQNPQNREIGEQMTARLLAEIITIAMRNKDQEVATMIAEITGLKLSLEIDEKFWSQEDAGNDLKARCKKQLQSIQEFRSEAEGLKSDGSNNPVADQVKDIFRKS